MNLIYYFGNIATFLKNTQAISRESGSINTSEENFDTPSKAYIN